MALVSVTRLRVRAWKYLPGFLLYTFRSIRQAERAPGLVGGWVGSAGASTFWTVTLWRDEASMRGFRDHDMHKRAMPKLLEWCGEAAVARFEQDGDAVPDAKQSLAEMNARGRTSKVRHPTPAHAAGRVVPDQRAPRPGKPLTPR